MVILLTLLLYVGSIIAPPPSATPFDGSGGPVTRCPVDVVDCAPPVPPVPPGG